MEQVILYVVAIVTLSMMSLVSALLLGKIKSDKIKRLRELIVTKQEIVNTVVWAVEQMYKDLEGPAKLEHAIKLINGQFKAKGIPIDEDEIRIHIEQLVLSMNQFINKKENA